MIDFFNPCITINNEVTFYITKSRLTTKRSSSISGDNNEKLFLSYTSH